MSKNNLEVGRYWYSRPGWEAPQPVEVEITEGTKCIRFFIEYKPIKLKDCPGDCILLRRYNKTPLKSLSRNNYLLYTADEPKEINEVIFTEGV